MNSYLIAIQCQHDKWWHCSTTTALFGQHVSLMDRPGPVRRYGKPTLTSSDLQAWNHSHSHKSTVSYCMVFIYGWHESPCCYLIECEAIAVKSITMWPLVMMDWRYVNNTSYDTILETFTAMRHESTSRKQSQNIPLVNSESQQGTVLGNSTCEIKVWCYHALLDSIYALYSICRSRLNITLLHHL